MHTTRRERRGGRRLATRAQPTRSRGSAWFIGLTILTLGLYVYFGGLVVIDAGANAIEAVHLVGAIGCTAIVAAGLIPQLVAPRRNVAAFQQAFVTGVALMVAAAIFGDPDNQGGQNGPFDVTYLIFFVPLLLLAVMHPARRELVRPGDVRPLLVLAAAAVAVPLFIYGTRQGLVQRNSWPPSADPHHNSHWFMMAELGFAIPLVAAVGRLGGRGWRVPAWTAPAVLAALGIVSVLFRHAPSSLGIGWGVLAVHAAVAYSVLSVVDIRSRRVQLTRVGVLIRAAQGRPR
jgi:hypothetical protein